MALRRIDNRGKLAHAACYTQYCVALRLRVSRVRSKDAAARKPLETEEAQFIQRESRMCVGGGHQGLEWLVNDLVSPRENYFKRVPLEWVGLAIAPVTEAGEANLAGRMPCPGVPRCYGKCGEDVGALVPEVITQSDILANCGFQCLISVGSRLA